MKLLEPDLVEKQKSPYSYLYVCFFLQTATLPTVIRRTQRGCLPPQDFPANTPTVSPVATSFMPPQVGEFRSLSISSVWRNLRTKGTIVIKVKE